MYRQSFALITTTEAISRNLDSLFKFRSDINLGCSLSLFDLQENTGNHWNMEAVFRSEIIGKIRKLSARNTASTKSSELPGNRRFRAGLSDKGNIITSL
jgi:hypothetical protein